MIDTEVRDAQVAIAQNKQWHRKLITCSQGLVTWLRQGKFIIIPAIVTITSAWILGAKWSLIMPIVILNVMLVSAEIFNTSIEKICDVVNGHWDTRIKEIKDISSSTVLVIGLTLLSIWLWVMIDLIIRH